MCHTCTWGLLGGVHLALDPSRGAWQPLGHLTLLAGMLEEGTEVFGSIWRHQLCVEGHEGWEQTTLYPRDWPDPLKAHLGANCQTPAFQVEDRVREEKKIL